MMKYVKPDVFVTRFSANAFCGSCAVTTYNKPVTVQCIKTQSETVYDSGVTGCDYTAVDLTLVTEAVTYKDSRDAELVAIKDLQDGIVGNTGYGSGNNSYILAPGYYLAWTKNNIPHAGPVPDATAESIKNHS